MADEKRKVNQKGPLQSRNNCPGHLDTQPRQGIVYIVTPGVRSHKSPTCNEINHTGKILQ